MKQPYSASFTVKSEPNSRDYAPFGKYIEYGTTRSRESCPICGTGHRRGKKAGCSTPNDGDMIFCKREINYSQGDTLNGYWFIGTADGTGWGKWGRERERDWKRDRPDRSREYAEAAERDRLEKIERAKTAADLDREYQFRIRNHPLSEAHHANLVKRGFNDADIERIGAYTLIGRLYVPIENLEGLKVGAQYKDPRGGYKWGRAGDNYTKEHGELPIAHWGDRDNPARILFVEGTGFKPYLTSKKFPRDLVLGAAGGQFAGSPKQIEQVLLRYPDAKLVLYPDGGSEFNPGVVGQYNRLFELVADREIAIGYWTQTNKSDGDIDEIGEGVEIKYISVDRWKSITKDGLHAVELGTIGAANKRGAIERAERYLSQLPVPKSASINFVSSGVGTGKTHQLADLFARWESAHPDGRTILLGYRNGLLEQLCARLNVTNWRVGNGMEKTAIAHERRIAIVVDSILKLDLTDIPAGTLIVMDEVEAVLNHLATGGTTKSRAAEIQARVTAIIERALAMGGAVIGLEDSITNVSIDGMRSLLGNKCPIDLTINNHERFNWDVSIGGGQPSNFVELLIARLMAGERLIVPTSSQGFGEALDRLVLAHISGIEGKIERVDARTINDKKALIADPVGYLRERGTQLLILSPTVESGFSIDDAAIDPLFDRVMAFFANLDTRTHKQMLARYRSDCPREVFALTKGCESVGDTGRDYRAALKIYRAIAQGTALEQGYGRIENNAIGEAWNTLDLQFKARAALSAAHLREYLRKELIDCGHRVSVVDWADVADEYKRTHGITIDWDVAAGLAEVKEEIKDAEALALFEADGTKLTVDGANNVLGSSGTSYEQKIVARKTLLHDRLPGISLSYDLIRDCVVEGRGRYLGQVELSYLIDKPDLAYALDRERLAKQLANPHVLYSRVPKYSQRVRVLFPIHAALLDLASGREYRDGDAAIETIAKYARSHSYDFWSLFSLNMRDSKESDRAIANKVLKRLGYETRRVRQLGTGTARISVYAIVNADCVHRAEIYKSLEIKHRETIERARLMELPDRHKLFNKEKPLLKSLCLTPPQSLETMPSNSYSQEQIAEVARELESSIGHFHNLIKIHNKYPADLIELAIELLPEDRKREATW